MRPQTSDSCELKRPVHRAAVHWPSTLRLTSWTDHALPALLCVQVVITFVVIPLGVSHPPWRAMLPFGNLLFAAICAVLLTQRTLVRVCLLVGVAALALVPLLSSLVGQLPGFGPTTWRELIEATAFSFNLLVTLLVGMHAFGSGQVTVQRIQGAVLVFLNVGVLFSIAFSLLEAHAPGAIQHVGAHINGAAPPVEVAEMTYFSLTTITTTGYGDMTPVHPLARSLANLEAFFGQLFPAIFLARVVALHLVHSGATSAPAVLTQETDSNLEGVMPAAAREHRGPKMPPLSPVRTRPAHPPEG